MTKYRILGGTPNADGMLELPDDAKIIGALYHPVTGELNVVLLKEILPQEAKEKTEENVIRLPVHPERKTAKEA